MYVGTLPVPASFLDTYVTSNGALVQVPKGFSGQDQSGNAIVFFDAVDEMLPWDGAHCWIHPAGRLNEWYSDAGRLGP